LLPVGGSLAEADPESSPTVQKVRALLAQHDFAGAVRFTYRAAFDGTVRAYGLSVPPACTDRQFLAGFLRPDMGKLSELLPQLFLLYEPVRFGHPPEPTVGDRKGFELLLTRLFSETPLGRIEDPLFQPSGIPSAKRETPSRLKPLTAPRKEGML